MVKPLAFYDCKTAPSPRRARMFLAEKSLNIETIEVDLGAQEQLTPAFRRINPRCTVPVLTLDDGTALTENAGIAHFLEAYQPTPPLLGVTPLEKGLITMWNARIEFDGLIPVADAFRNRSKGLQGRAVVGPRDFEQIPALAERGRARAIDFFDMLDQALVDSTYLVGDTFSYADITALCVIDFAAWIKITPNDTQSNLLRWLELVKQRPSAKL